MKNNFKLTILAMIITGLLLSGIATAQTPTQTPKQNPQALQTQGTVPPVAGSGTTGQIPKWTGSSTTSYTLGDSTITEDKYGKVGIGTTTPTSKLTVQGMVETTLGGVKFPDGTVQTTAAGAPNTGVQSLNGLTGNLMLAAGSNITITPNGNTLTVSATSTSGDSATSAFTRDLVVDLPLGQSLVQKEFDSPPGSDNLRFVIEYLSLEALAFVKEVTICTTVNGTQTCYLFPMTYTGPTRSVVDRSLKLYADGNSKIKVIVGRTAPNSIDGLTIHLSGYTVPLP